MRPANVALAVIIPGLVAIDLLTKAWARMMLDLGATPIDIAPFVSLQLAYNAGISFGWFASGAMARVLVTLVAASLTVALCIWFGRSRSARDRLGLGLMIAGAVSNLLDRLPAGTVTDFLAFGMSERPVFINNLADIWIGLGVIVLFGARLIRGSRGSDVNPKAAG